MERDCRRLRSRLPSVAAGDRDQEVEQHVRECGKCKEIVDQLEKMNAAGRLPRFDPPDEAVGRAKSVFRPARRLASLVRSSLAGAGARRVDTNTFQCLFEAEGVRVRVGYSRSGALWVVHGEVPERFSLVRQGRRRIPIEGGRFRFETKSLKRSGFTLVGVGEEVEVPPPEVTT